MDITDILIGYWIITFVITFIRECYLDKRSLNTKVVFIIFLSFFGFIITPCYLFEKSINNLPKDIENDTISDGFGSEWNSYCPKCGKKTMEVVRPGKVQCNNCDDKEFGCDN
jgi:hypothetical protein